MLRPAQAFRLVGAVEASRPPRCGQVSRRFEARRSAGPKVGEIARMPLSPSTMTSRASAAVGATSAMRRAVRAATLARTHSAPLASCQSRGRPAAARPASRPAAAAAPGAPKMPSHRAARVPRRGSMRRRGFSSRARAAKRANPLSSSSPAFLRQIMEPFRVSASLTRSVAASANFDDFYQIDPDLSITKCSYRNHGRFRNALRAPQAPRSVCPTPLPG